MNEIEKKTNKNTQKDTKDTWQEIWAQCIYSIDDLMDKDEWIGIKNSQILPYIIKLIPQDAIILEAGCGMGPWVLYLTKLHYNIIGIDIALETISHTKKLFPNSSFIGGDITNICFKENSLDAVLSWGVVEHFESGPQRALEEIRRVLKPHCRLFITVPCKNVIYHSPLLKFADLLRKNKLIRKILNKGQFHEEFYQYLFSKRRFYEELIKAGFEIEEFIPISHEMGFVSSVNRHLFKGSKLFHQNKNCQWKGLSTPGSIICNILKRISPWITPDQIFSIAIKK